MLWVVFNRKRQGVPFPAFTIFNQEVKFIVVGNLDYASFACSAAVAFLAIL
jgi:hypothetical protein